MLVHLRTLTNTGLGKNLASNRFLRSVPVPLVLLAAVCGGPYPNKRLVSLVSQCKPLDFVLR